MDIVSAALANPFNRKILERMALLGLEDCWLVAGCLFQTLWNLKAGRPATQGIKDYDLFYFDDRDLSHEAEDREIGRTGSLFRDLDILVELKNQARVHLWYERKFGVPCPPLRNSREGIDRFPVAGTCLGLQPMGDGSLRLYAPFGTQDVERGILRPNPRTLGNQHFMAKARSYQSRWPWLEIEPEFDKHMS